MEVDISLRREATMVIAAVAHLKEDTAGKHRQHPTNLVVLQVLHPAMANLNISSSKAMIPTAKVSLSTSKAMIPMAKVSLSTNPNLLNPTTPHSHPTVVKLHPQLTSNTDLLTLNTPSNHPTAVSNTKTPTVKATHPHHHNSSNTHPHLQEHIQDPHHTADPHHSNSTPAIFPSQKATTTTAAPILVDCTVTQAVVFLPHQWDHTLINHKAAMVAVDITPIRDTNALNEWYFLVCWFEGWRTWLDG